MKKTFKCIFILSITILLAVSCCACALYIDPVRQDTYFESGYFKCYIKTTLFWTEVVIFGLTEEGKQQKEIVLPNTLKGIEVKYLGDVNSSASKWNYFTSDNLERLYIPSDIEFGSSHALEGCPGLKEIIDVSVSSRDVPAPSGATVYVAERALETRISADRNVNYKAANVEFRDCISEGSANNKGVFWLDNREGGERLVLPPEQPFSSISEEFAGWSAEGASEKFWDFENDVMPDEGAVVLEPNFRPKDPETQQRKFETEFFKLYEYRDDKPSLFSSTVAIVYGLTDKGKEQKSLTIPDYVTNSNGKSIKVERLGEKKDNALQYNYFESENLEKLDFSCDLGSEYALSKCPKINKIFYHGNNDETLAQAEYAQNTKICVKKSVAEKLREARPDLNVAGFNVTFVRPNFDVEVDEESKSIQFVIGNYSDDSSTIEFYADYVEIGDIITKPEFLEVDGFDPIFPYYAEGCYTEKELINKWEFDNSVMPSSGQLTLYVKFVRIS